MCFAPQRRALFRHLIFQKRENLQACAALQLRGVEEVPELSEEPQPRGVIVVVQDITERMLPELQTLHPAEAEAAVKEMHMLIDETFVPIWGTDRDWKITARNLRGLDSCQRELGPEAVILMFRKHDGRELSFQALAKPLLSLDIFAQAEEMSNALRQFFSGEIGGMRAMRKDVVLIAGDKHLQAEIAILPRGISKDAEVLIVANLNAGLQSATNESQGEVEEPTQMDTVSLPFSLSLSLSLPLSLSVVLLRLGPKLCNQDWATKAQLA
eukprot:s123_g16.t1